MTHISVLFIYITNFLYKETCIQQTELA